MAIIPLTQGKVAIIDDADYERINQYKWYAYRDGLVWYAGRGVRIQGKGVIRVMLHQFIFGGHGCASIDHINLDGLDNRKDNLRLCTASQNQANRRKCKGSSMFKGVSWIKKYNKWYASIKKDGRSFNLGLYNNETDAAKAYNNKAVVMFGEFARINSI